MISQLLVNHPPHCLVYNIIKKHYPLIARDTVFTVLSWKRQSYEFRANPFLYVSVLTSQACAIRVFYCTVKSFSLVSVLWARALVSHACLHVLDSLGTVQADVQHSSSGPQIKRPGSE